MSKDHSQEETSYVSTTTCLICLETTSPSETRDLCCGHSFCAPCTESYILNLIESNKITKIKCPHYNCTAFLTSSQILSFLCPQDGEKFQSKILEKTLNRDLYSKFCPRTGCSKKLTSSLKSLTCECGAKICSTCGDFSHDGKSCLEAIDLKYEAFARENEVRFCIICKSQIQRNRGCDHIICPVCDFEFCWLCGREYSQGHRSSCITTWCPEPPEAPKDYSFIKCIMIPIIIVLFFSLSMGLDYLGEDVWLVLLAFDTIMCLCSKLEIVCILSGLVFTLKMISYMSNIVGWGVMITICFVGLSWFIRHFHILNKKRWKSSSIEELKFLSRDFNAK